MNARKVFEGKHVIVLERGDWEFVERKKAREAVVIVAITEDDRIILTEQFRQAVNARVIDLPAGLIEEESQVTPAAPPASGRRYFILQETAKRELEEETGYTCEAVELVASGPTSPGITTEIAHFFLAKKVRRRGKGGGVEGEDITVHQVPRREAEKWLERKARQGILIDLKIWVGLYFAAQST